MIVDVSRTGVAVSGGADSVYLLHQLLDEGCHCVVLHVNHLLRDDESDADEKFVRAMAASLNVDCLVIRERPGEGNLEQAAREVRYRWFRELIEARTVERVALGHTLSDQAETVLFRFLRGTGTAGLAGIRPVTREVFRPLLGITREAIRQSLLSRGITWREDSSNSNLSFARNRIRTELLPQLERDWNPGFTGALGQMADWALAEEKYWAGQMKKLGAKFFSENGAGLIVRWPRRLAVAVQRRLLRHAIETVLGHLRQIEYGHVEAVRGLRSGKLSLPGLTVEKSFEWLRFAAAGAVERDVLDGVGLELLAASSVYNEDEHQLDWGSLSGPLKLRSWHPGDRYRRVGRPTEERLKLLFQKARIPVWERRSWPVLLCGDKIVWARKFGVAEGAERTESTQMVLLIRDPSGFPNLKS
jgi:tRNA(Ile)-lysidine synthase